VHQEKTMNKSLGIGAGIGAALMFFLDPKMGNRRRSVMAHKFSWLGRKIGKGVSWPVSLFT
jgi:hypothetical protein